MSVAEKLFKQDAWLVLAKLADHARRNGGRLRPAAEVSEGITGTYNVTLSWPRSLSRWSFTYEQHSGAAIAFAEEESTVDEYAAAERMALAWGERMQAIESAMTDERAKPVELGQSCGACDAGAGQWCRPLHGGERDSGTWTHPIRQIPRKKDADPSDPRALRVARDVLHVAGTGVEFRGLPRSFRDQLVLLATEVVNAEGQRRLGMLPRERRWSDGATPDDIVSDLMSLADHLHDET